MHFPGNTSDPSDWSIRFWTTRPKPQSRITQVENAGRLLESYNRDYVKAERALREKNAESIKKIEQILNSAKQL